MKIKNKCAFTLVEIMVVVLISTGVFAGIYSTFIVGNRAWGHYNDSIAVKKEARRALFGMVKELREAENVRVVQGPQQSTVHFYRPSTGAVSYSWSCEGDDANRIIRRNRSGVRILAQNISALSFQKLRNAVVIDITASKPTAAGDIMQVVLKEKVALRSKTTMFR